MAQSRLNTSLRAFRHRNFRLFFAGQLTSLVGTWMQTVAQSWLAYRLTGSAALLGIVGFASQFPILVLAPIAGSVADTYPRRRSMLAIQTAAMLLAFPLAALTLLNRIQVWHVLVLAALLGIVNACDIPVRQSFVAEMVGREDLVNAIALNSLMLIGVISLMGMPYSVLMPIFADHILNGGAKGLGFLMGFSGIGALLGAVTLAGRQGIRGLSTWVMLACMGFGTSLILFSASRVFWLSTVLLVPVGFCMMVQLASSNTLIQSMVPDRLRGRVMAVYSMMFMGMAPFGALLAGLLATRLGAPLTVAIGGMVCVGGAAIFRSKLPAVRAEGRQLILAQMMTAGEPPESGSPNISS